MSIIRICGIKKHSFVDGPGTRFTLFTQGCPHCCPGCHNPETADPNAGILTDTINLITQIRETKYLDGLTLSGGDPFLQGKAIAEIAKAAGGMGLSVWAYTGWTWEELIQNKAGDDAQKALQYVDVLVDGRFMKNRMLNAPIWRGSSNQRLIDVKQSLKTGTACIYEHHYELKTAN